MLKKGLLFLTILAFSLHLNAQEESNTKLAIETGIVGLFDSEKFGMFLNVEPKHRFSDNAFIGLRIAVSINTQTVENADISEYSFDDGADNGVFSLTPTFDYYFEGKKYRPYAGAGIGYYLMGTYVDVSRVIISNPDEDMFEADIKNQVGGLLRAGLESDKLRLGVEYNFVPKASVELPNGEVAGMVDKSYLGLSIGFKIGAKRHEK